MQSGGYLVLGVCVRPGGDDVGEHGHFIPACSAEAADAAPTVFEAQDHGAVGAVDAVTAVEAAAATLGFGDGSSNGYLDHAEGFYGAGTHDRGCYGKRVHVVHICWR